MKFTEYINYENLQKLNFTNLDFIIENSSKCKTDKPWSSKYISKGLKNMKKENIITYKYGKEYSSGRMYCVTFGLQACPSSVRGYLTEGTGYKDYDIKNAHYSILLNLCNNANINSKYVKQYVENREGVLSKYNLSKKLLLTFLNLDNPNNYDNEFLILLGNELKSIKQQIISLHFNKISKTDNKKNPISSQVSQILGYFENETLMKIVKTYKLTDAVLIFDGFMTRTELPLESLKELTGYDYVTKPFEPIDMTSLDEYSNQKIEMEQNNFISLEPFTRWSRINDKYDYVQQSKTDFEDRNAIYQYINSNDQLMPIMSRWLADPSKRTFDTTAFNPDPNFDNPRIYNLFKPFVVHSFEKNLVEIDDFKSLMKNLAGGVPENEEYLLNYISHLFQYPHQNPQTCLVLKGKQGNGKDTLTEIINKLMGYNNNYLTKIADINKVVGNFTDCLDKKLVIQLNEMSGNDGVKFQNRLKDLITSENNLVRKLYQNTQTQTNYIRWIIFSNTITPVVVEITDRRFFICETGDDNLGNTVYWNRIYNHLKNEDYLYSIHNFLMERDIELFNPKVIPKNDDKINLQYANINPIYKFIKETFDTQKWIIKTIKGMEFHLIKSSDLYWEYQDSEDFRDEKEKLFRKIILNLKGVSQKRVKGYSVNMIAIDKQLLFRDLSLLVPEIIEEEVDDP